MSAIGENKKDVLKTLFKYIFSSMAAMWVFSIYTMVDGMFVARGVGPEALAAINLAMPVINISFGLSILFSIGASTRTSIYKGMGDYEKADKIFTLSTLTVLGLSIVVTVLCLVFMTPLIRLLGADGATAGYVRTYLSIVLLFDVSYMVAYNLEVLVKADGFPQKAIYVPTIGAATNICLDYVFIFIFRWGIAGAAWATGISQFLTLVIFGAHFLSSKSGFSFVKIRYSIKEALGLASLGVADCVTELSIGIVILIFNKVLGRISGDDGIVIYTVISYVSQLILMTMVGLNQGMQPLTSYYLGKGDDSTRKYIFRVSFFMAAGLSVLAFFAGYLEPNSIVGLFIDSAKNPDLYAHGVRAFRMYSFCFLPIGMVVVIAGYLTSMEKARSAMTISLCRGLIFVIIALFVLTSLFGEAGVWMSMTVSETLSLAVALVLYMKNKKSERELDHERR